MKCSNCGSEIADDAQFCGICGQETKVTSCPNCGVSLKQGLFFCPSCGVKLKEKTPPQMEAIKEEPKLSKLDQEIKEQEIRRLIKVNQKRFSTAPSREPKIGLLTDEEILNISYLDISGREISSLQGIEYFTSLTYLSCSKNHLTSLDVSKNPALKYLDCDNNRLTSLDVSKNTALQSLNCDFNPLSK